MVVVEKYYTGYPEDKCRLEFVTNGYSFVRIVANTGMGSAKKVDILWVINSAGDSGVCCRCKNDTTTFQMCVQ